MNSYGTQPLAMKSFQRSDCSQILKRMWWYQNKNERLKDDLRLQKVTNDTISINRKLFKNAITTCFYWFLFLLLLAKIFNCFSIFCILSYICLNDQTIFVLKSASWKAWHFHTLWSVCSFLPFFVNWSCSFQWSITMIPFSSTSSPSALSLE